MTWPAGGDQGTQGFTAPQQSQAALVASIASLNQILSKLEISATLIFAALGQINTTLGAVFPQATGDAATATGGAATLPANPVGFIEVYVPSLAATVLVPYYSP